MYLISGAGRGQKTGWSEVRGSDLHGAFSTIEQSRLETRLQSLANNPIICQFGDLLIRQAKDILQDIIIMLAYRRSLPYPQ